ncbi:MAG: lactonase family protein, partial [Spirochaetota bacterium]
SSYSIDAITRRLQWVSTQPTHGTDPCHLIVNSDGSMLFVANFMSGSIAWYPLEPDGTIREALGRVQHAGFSVDPVRQKGPHAHAVVLSPDERFLFVPDLGLDRTVVYEIDRIGNKLVLRDDLAISCAPGAGPRQLVFHHKLPFAYVVNELNSTIDALSYDPSSGQLSRIATVSTLPVVYTGNSTCADIHISTTGKYLFASNRGHDSLAVYRISPADGTLKLLGTSSTGGACPRNFAISGEYCFVANQDSDSIVVFTLDENTGKLLRHGETIGIPTPVCIIGT